MGCIFELMVVYWCIQNRLISQCPKEKVGSWCVASHRTHLLVFQWVTRCRFSRILRETWWDGQPHIFVWFFSFVNHGLFTNDQVPDRPHTWSEPGTMHLWWLACICAAWGCLWSTSVHTQSYRGCHQCHNFEQLPRLPSRIGALLIGSRPRCARTQNINNLQYTWWYADEIQHTANPCFSALMHLANVWRCGGKI